MPAMKIFIFCLLLTAGPLFLDAYSYGAEKKATADEKPALIIQIRQPVLDTARPGPDSLQPL